MNFMFQGKLLLIALLSSAHVAHGTCVNKVTGYQVVNLKDNTKTDLTGSPATIDLTKYDKCQINIIALTSSTPANCKGNEIRCVKIERGTQSRLETTAPYAFYGNQGTKFYAGTPDYGEDRLRACTYTDSKCTQNKGGCLDLNVKVVGGKLDAFVVYDADTNKPIADPSKIENGKAICLPKSRKVNIEATTTNQCIGSVKLELSGTDGKSKSRVEKAYPFFLYGDDTKGDVYGEDGFRSNTNPTTDYTVKATPNKDDSKLIQAKFSFKNCS